MTKDDMEGILPLNIKKDFIIYTNIAETRRPTGVDHRTFYSDTVCITKYLDNMVEIFVNQPGSWNHGTYYIPYENIVCIQIK